MKYSFSNKTVIVTGASDGIGKELVIQLARLGAEVVLAARNKNKMEKVVESCLPFNEKLLAIPTDVSVKEQCEHLIKKTVENFGKIDILINNAGITMSSNFADVNDISLFAHIMETNYLGSVYCTYYALPHLLKSKGIIVGISSLTGKNGVPTRSGYAASKHAMAGFFDSLRIELAETGVNVTMIYPGFVQTDIRKNALNPDGKPAGKSHISEKGIMSVEKCSAIIIESIAKKKREVVMTLRGKIGLFLKLLFPSLVDSIARKSIESGKT